MKAIEEETEIISEDESRPSSIRNSESSEKAIDDVDSALSRIKKELSVRALGSAGTRGEARRASPVEIPSSPVLIPLPDSCSSYVFLLSITMGRKKKKKNPLIPWSQWTPVVQGLIPSSSDTSFETSDFEPPLPMEPIEEDDEEMSEDDHPSSIGGSNASAASIDDVFAQRDDGPASSITDSGICQGPDLLGFPDLHDSLQIEDDAVHLRLQKDKIGPLGSDQQNPNDLIPPVDDFDLPKSLPLLKLWVP
ncbi:hypothetical protein Dimus_036823 [Dionaea muscipula]